MHLLSRRGREAHVVLESDWLGGSDTLPAANSKLAIGAPDLQGGCLVSEIAKIDARHLVVSRAPAGTFYLSEFPIKAITVKKLERVALGDHHRLDFVVAYVLIHERLSEVGAS